MVSNSLGQVTVQSELRSLRLEASSPALRDTGEGFRMNGAGTIAARAAVEGCLTGQRTSTFVGSGFAVYRLNIRDAARHIFTVTEQ